MCGRTGKAFALVLLAGCTVTDPPPVQVATNKPKGPVLPTSVTYGVAAPLGTELAASESKKAAALLAKAFGLPVTERVLSYDDAVNALAKGEIDVALVPPLSFVRARRLAPVEALRKAVFNGQPTYRAVLFVRGDSKAKTLDDLKGKSVAWVEKGSLSGNLAPRGMLRDRGIDPNTYFANQQELPDHAAVCAAVDGKKVDVGASLTSYSPGAADLVAGGTELANVKVDGCTAALGDKAGTLRAILMSEPVPNSLVAMRVGFPPELGGKVGELLDELSKTDAGKAQLKEAFGADRFVLAFSDDLDPLSRALDFEEGKVPATK